MKEKKGDELKKNTHLEGKFKSDAWCSTWGEIEHELIVMAKQRGFEVKFTNCEGQGWCKYGGKILEYGGEYEIERIIVLAHEVGHMENDFIDKKLSRTGDRMQDEKNAWDWAEKILKKWLEILPNNFEEMKKFSLKSHEMFYSMRRTKNRYYGELRYMNRRGF